MSSLPLSSNADYAWEVATLFPEQGAWTEEAYLTLTDGTNRRIELNDGRLEFLPMPTEFHEALVQFLFLALYQFVDRLKLGKVYSNGIRVRVGEKKVRFPDVVFLHKDHFSARHNRTWDGADVVMEVVSEQPSDRQRDYDDKLREYADAKVPEYWIVDPTSQIVSVYVLAENGYAVHGKFGLGQLASSKLLPGFEIDVASLFAATDGIPD
jgi:Uma2 family endonuclease